MAQRKRIKSAAKKRKKNRKLKASYFSLIGIASIIIGNIFFHFQQKKNKGKKIEKDYSKIDLNQVYIYEPNWKRIKIEWALIVTAGIITFIYSHYDKTFNNIGSKLSVATFIVVVLSFIWTIIFLIFNNRKIILTSTKISTYSFLTKKSTDTNWEDLDTVEYVIQNDRIRFTEKKPNEFHSSIGLMHYRAYDQWAIRILFDANLDKRGKALKIKGYIRLSQP
ncbi:MAG: hypothetical protein JXA16_15745 [Bacteroidales bacterium]|nr:hypothetical protein [Bacteroidales bacterium]